MSAAQRLASSMGTVSLGLVALLPVLNPLHTLPIPSFYSEWLAAALGLVVIGCAIFAPRPAGGLQVPALVLLPLGLAAAVLVQLTFDHVSHPRYALLYCSILLFAGALMMIGRLNADRLGLERVADILATGLVAGALLQSAVVLLQRAGVDMPWIGLTGGSGTSSGGVLGQRNHLVDYLWLGIASVMYLRVTERISPWIASTMIVGLAVVSVLPGSRSAFLYPTGLAALAILAWYRSGRQAAWRTLAIVCLLTIPAMLVVDRFPGTGTTTGSTATERLAAPELDPIRSGLLQVAWLAVLDRPLSGYGVGAAPNVTFQHAATWPKNTRPVVAEHFHNLAAQWLVEFGLPITLAALGFIAFWLISAIRNARSAAQWWIVSLLVVVGLHSQLEYPLWLVYFLVPTTIVAGAVGPNLPVRLQLGPRHMLVAAIGLTTAGATMASLLLDYRQLEIVAAASGPKMGPRHLEQAIASALTLERESLLAPQATVLLAGAMGVSQEGAAEKWSLCRQALRISPTRDVVLKCPALAAINGERSEAQRLQRLGMILYGDNPYWWALRAEFPELNDLQTAP